MELFVNTENTNNNWIEINTLPDVKQPENFWETINLLIKNPHFINRNLMGCTNLYLFKCCNDIQTVKCELNKIINSLYTEESVNLTTLNTLNSLEIYDFTTEKCISSSTTASTTEVSPETVTIPNVNHHEEEILFFNYFHKSNVTENNNSVYFLINKLHPKNMIKWKNNIKYNYEFYIVNEQEKSLIMISYQYDQYQFGKIQLINSSSPSQSSSQLSIYGQEQNTQMFMDWLKFVLSPRFIKWLENDTNNIKTNKDQNKDFVLNKSLALVNIEYYTELYNLLKEKYSGHLLATWPEKTDAIKFVYEDVAIATYLILLWKREDSLDNTNNKSAHSQRQKFVDLGCGNGLLVHLLASEGYSGFGIDMRRRRIWDTYPKTTVLKEQTIIPSNEFLFPDVNWIIGNHSDELSPWIPVIAARSSYTTKYFLLPCCAYNFNGSKFQRRDSTKSQYMDFLAYTKEISTVCGFETIIDRLKIPSTKRICLIGTKRQYTIEEFQHFDGSINDYINLENLTSRKRIGCNNNNNNTITDAIVDHSIQTTIDDQQQPPPLHHQMWTDDFKPREAIERVRNCTKINKVIEKDIVDIVFKELLIKKRILDDNDFYKPNWNIGGCLLFSEIIAKIPNDKLKALKSECGGLQTLLKNNHQIFRVGFGQIQLRIPQKLTTKKLLHQKLTEKFNQNVKSKKMTFKQKPCWYLENHPDGCPFLDIDCSFKHL